MRFYFRWDIHLVQCWMHLSTLQLFLPYVRIPFFLEVKSIKRQKVTSSPKTEIISLAKED